VLIYVIYWIRKNILMLMRNLGDNRKYDGKVIWKALNLDKWNYEGQDEKYSYLRLYSQVLYSPPFKATLLRLEALPPPKKAVVKLERFVQLYYPENSGW
jgi:hypothetical protein